MYFLQKYLLQKCSHNMGNRYAGGGVHWCRPSCWRHTLKTHEKCPCNRILKHTNKLGMFSVSVLFQVSDSRIPLTAFIILILLLSPGLRPAEFFFFFLFFWSASQIGTLETLIGSRQSRACDVQGKPPQ